jgi:hypothetical protein
MGTKTVGEAYVNHSGALATVAYSSGCDGRSATPCNADLARTLITRIDDLPEGANPLQSHATDVPGKTGAGSTLTVEVDRTPPTGSLATAPTFVHGTTTFSGSISDDRSGAGRWILQAARGSSSVGQSVRTATQASADGSWQCLEDVVLAGDGGPDVAFTPSATVTVDHTAPTAPTGLHATYDPDSFTTHVSWDDSTDPLPEASSRERDHELSVSLPA